MIYHVEYTDTFGGEANYSWVRRYDLELPVDASDRQILMAARRAVGLTGVRGVTDKDHDDCLTFRPYGYNTVMFVTYDY